MLTFLKYVYIFISPLAFQKAKNTLNYKLILIWFLTLVENGEFKIETTTKLPISFSALCCLATAAFSGRPNVSVCDMNGFHVGLGVGYNSYT